MTTHRLRQFVRQSDNSAVILVWENLLFPTHGRQMKQARVVQWEEGELWIANENFDMEEFSDDIAHRLHLDTAT